VTVLASPAGAEIARLVPEVDAVRVYDAPWMKAAGAVAPVATDALVAHLRAGGFDAAVVFTVSSQSALPAALVCWLAGIPLRLAHCRENPYALLTDWVRDPEPDAPVRHEVERQLALVGAIGCRPSSDRLSLRVPRAARRAADILLRAAGVASHRPWVAIHPGASAPSRRYPPESFAAVAARLVADGRQVVFLGGGAERALVDEIRDRMGCRSASLAGATDVATLAAVVARAPLLVANNSGPAHVAAALGTPLVELYALTNLQHTPWRVPARVLFADVPCRDCRRSVCPEGHHRCLRDVPPAAVVAAVDALLAPAGEGASA
jgi:lipopolysaccharide heptosyltransferase II